MFVEDISAFINPAEFAQSVTVGGVVVSAIFDNGYALGNVGLSGMATTQPTLTLASADVSTNPVGASVLVGPVAYVVAAHEPDGTGISRLLLELGA
jgi:hypothetical protein